MLIIFIVRLDVSFNSHSNHDVRSFVNLKELPKSILSKFSEMIALFQSNLIFMQNLNSRNQIFVHLNVRGFMSDESCFTTDTVVPHEVKKLL